MHEACALIKLISLFWFCRKALSAGKHVLVEFPAVTSASAAKELYEMAQEKGTYT